MLIPTTPQDLLPALPKKVNTTLTPHLSNWQKLHDYMTFASQDDIAQLLVLEARGEKRAHILTRLCAKYAQMESRRLKALFNC